MRTALAFIALFCGATAASANATLPDWWCSKGFDQPIQLVIEFELYKLLLNGKTIETHYVYDREGQTFFLSRINYWRNFVQHTDEPVIIYKDRVFWPCPSTHKH